LALVTYTSVDEAFGTGWPEKKPLYRLRGRRKTMNMNKPLMVLVMLVLTTFVGMIAWADLADAFKRTPTAAHSSITNHTGTTTSTSKDSTSGDGNSTPTITNGGDVRNTTDRMKRSALGGIHSCYQQCRMECPNGKDGGPCDNMCQKNCGGR
jgi:hypothetical protein